HRDRSPGGWRRGDLLVDGEVVAGRLEPAALHCPPRQAYITVSGTCIFRCRYCPVPDLPGRRKGVDEIVRMVESVADRVDGISITSGVAPRSRRRRHTSSRSSRRSARSVFPSGGSRSTPPGPRPPPGSTPSASQR
ncbi:radical SAM protein, partial [Methanoculleus chikugoensis]|uniref:radical SAM protein n=1 Tax=Methanoculleus chikugoensis TaxID=118126 RepID=UPI000AE16AC2